MNKSKVVILGLGMQGKAALHDIVYNSDASPIIVIDNSSEPGSYITRFPSQRVYFQRINAADETRLASILRDAGVVIEALPGEFSFPVGRLAAKLGVNLVSSMYYINPGEQDTAKLKLLREELRRIHREAKDKGFIILTEFGLDPGIDLVLGAQALGEMDKVDTFYSYGTGLPILEAANNPLKYKFSWSIIGVMRAYHRPAKIISGGKVVDIDAREMFAAENIHMLDIAEIGASLECYPNGNSEYYAELFGIRDSVREMARYSCRWPGHCAFWETMAKSGFLNEEPIRVGSTSVSPVEFTASLLGSQHQFQYADNEQDFTLIRVDVRGISKGRKKRVVYQLIDRKDLDTGFTSMQRTVGFTMSLGARLILEGQLKPGLLSPGDVPFDLVVQGLEKHGISISRQEL